MTAYHLAPEHIDSLYRQEYLHTAQMSKKFLSLDGQLQRAIIEEALIETEAMKLSQTYGEDASRNEAAYFEKYTEFYAYQAAKEPAKFREKDSRFLTVNFTKKSRDSARAIAITSRARKIDAAKSGLNISRIKTIADRSK